MDTGRSISSISLLQANNRLFNHSVHLSSRAGRRNVALRALPAREGVERQQIKWFAFAAALTLAWILVFEKLLNAEGRLLEAIAGVSSLLFIFSIPMTT